MEQLVGIGRFSALSYRDVVKITSYHEGTEYSYLMYKENNRLNIDLLFSKPTNHKNGVAVEIEVEAFDVNKFVLAILNQLAYFTNLVVIENIENKPYGIENKFNRFKIKNYKNFSVNSLSSSISGPTILLGKVNYPLRWDKLKKAYPHHVIHLYHIALKFNIGDIGVTPNREELLYTNESIEKIEKALDAAIEEIDILFKKKHNKDYQDINEFFESLKEENKITLVKDDLGGKVVITKPRDQGLKLYKGVGYDVSQISYILDKIYRYRLPAQHNYELTRSKALVNRYYYGSVHSFLDDSRIVICDVKKLKANGKAYIRENFNTSTKFIKSFSSFSLIKKILKDFSPVKGFKKDILRLILDYLVYKYKKLPTFKESDVPKKFIEERKAATKAKRLASKKGEGYWKQNVSLEHYDHYGLRTAGNYKLKDLNIKFKSLVVYSYKKDPRLQILSRNLLKVKFVGIAPTKMKLLKSLSNFVELDEFMDKKYKAIRNSATATLLLKKIPNLRQLANNELLKAVSVKLYDIVNSLYSFCKENHKGESSFTEEIYDYCVEQNAFNEEILGLYEANKKALSSLDVFVLFSSIRIAGYGGEERNKLINISTDYVLSKKLFKPDVEAVKKLRKETILNIK